MDRHVWGWLLLKLINDILGINCTYWIRVRKLNRIVFFSSVFELNMKFYLDSTSTKTFGKRRALLLKTNSALIVLGVSQEALQNWLTVQSASWINTGFIVTRQLYSSHSWLPHHRHCTHELQIRFLPSITVSNLKITQKWLCNVHSLISQPGS